MPVPAAVLTRIDPRRRLARGVRRALRETAPVVRVEALLDEPVDVLGWLARVGEGVGQTVYWSSRDGDDALAGVGAADVISGPTRADVLATLSARTRDLTDGSRYVGGFRFAEGTPDPEWADFGAGRFVLPRIELSVRDGQARLAVHVVPSRDSADAVLDVLDAVPLPEPKPLRALPLPIRRLDRPDREGWAGAVRDALARIGGGPLRKVVLARRAEYGFEEALDPATLLRHLSRSAPRAFHVLLDDGAGRTFVAATPERLVRAQRGQAWTEALAGTRRLGDGRGRSAMRDELARSDKDRREHAFVRDAVTEALAPLSELVAVDPPEQVEAARVRHLLTPIRARLRPGTRALDVVRALHPTPAVGGTPTPLALDAIAKLEPFDRGLYAGPVGWVGRDAAEFAVGIRSGLVAGDRLALFVGAGIVPGSEPDAEWDETEAKLGAFADALGLDV